MLQNSHGQIGAVTGCQPALVNSSTLYVIQYCIISELSVNLGQPKAYKATRLQVNLCVFDNCSETSQQYYETTISQYIMLNGLEWMLMQIVKTSIIELKCYLTYCHLSLNIVTGTFSQTAVQSFEHLTIILIS